MKLFNIGEISQRAKDTFSRFPLTLIWSILGTFYIIFLISQGDNKLIETHLRYIVTLILGISWLIGTKFFIEQQENPKKKWWFKIITLALLLLFCFHLPSNDSFGSPIYITRFILYLIAGHLFVFIAPFIGNWNKEAYWNYLKEIFIAIGRSLLFSVVLYLGLVLALLAVKYLFNFDIKGERYAQLFVFCLGIVNTWIYLADFPKNIQSQTTINYPKAVEVFVKYILIPLAILYIIILYAYSLKIVIAWSLPKGWVTYLVTALAALGFIIQVLINPIQKTIKSRTINKFHPWFYYVLLPLIILLFVAIFKRINDYGFTEERYFVLVVSIWILVMTLYLLFSKNKYIKVLPISLCIIALLASFGFWSAFNVSKNSQVNRFENIFNQVKLNNNIASVKEYNSLNSILKYLKNRNDLSELNPIVEIDLDDIKDSNKNKKSPYRYFSTNRILDSLQINESEKDQKIRGNKYMNFSLDLNTNSIKIKGYDEIIMVNFNERAHDANTYENYSFSLNNEKTKGTIKQDNQTIFILDFETLANKFYNKGYNWQYAPEDALFIEENKDVKMKIILHNINVVYENNSASLRFANAYVLIKNKSL